MTLPISYFVDPPDIPKNVAKDPEKLQTLLEEIGRQFEAVSGSFDDIKTAFPLSRGQMRKANPAVVTTEQTIGASGAITDLGGPQITIKAGVGTFIAVFFEAEIKNAGAGEDPWIHAVLDNDTTNGIIASFVQTDATGTYRRAVSSNWHPKGVLSVFPMTASSHNIKLYYSNAGGAGTVYFKNRKLWAFVL